MHTGADGCDPATFSDITVAGFVGIWGDGTGCAAAICATNAAQSAAEMPAYAFAVFSAACCKSSWIVIPGYAHPTTHRPDASYIVSAYGSYPADSSAAFWINVKSFAVFENDCGCNKLAPWATLQKETAKIKYFAV